MSEIPWYIIQYTEANFMTKASNLPKYVSLSKTGVYQYRRRVPDTLRTTLGQTEIKRGFGKDYGTMLKEYAKLEREVTQWFAEAKPKQGDNYAPVINAAMRKYGITMQLLATAASNDDDSEEGEGLSAAILAMLDELAGNDPNNPKVPIELLRELTAGRSIITLKSALEEHRDRQIRRYPSNERQIRSRFARHQLALSRSIGRDLAFKRPLAMVKRVNANSFRDHLLEAGHKPSTVRRIFNDINAAVNKAINEHDLDMANPFSKIEIEGAQHSKDDRLPFTDEEMQQLLPVMKGEDIRSLIWDILRVTGARPKEVIGLRGCDFNETDATIYIRSYEGNRLKTAHSERELPIPASLASKLADLIPEEATEPLFPSYKNAPRGNDSCTQALNKRIHRAIEDQKKSVYSLRHRFKDLLRDTDCPESLAREIMGHSDQSSAANYGRGSSLKRKRDAMEKVWSVSREDLQ